MVEIDSIKCSIPIKDVLHLYDMVRGYPELVNDVEILIYDYRQLRTEVEALRSLYRELMVAFSDLRRLSKDK